MNTRHRNTNAHTALNKLKVKSLKVLRQAIENREDRELAVIASYNVLSLLKEYE